MILAITKNVMFNLIGILEAMRNIKFKAWLTGVLRNKIMSENKFFYFKENLIFNKKFLIMNPPKILKKGLLLLKISKLFGSDN